VNFWIIGYKLQGQANLSGTDSGVLPSLQASEMFVNVNMQKGPVHSKEFSIQNEQEFPALPTATQPRDEQVNNSEVQQSLQVCQLSIDLTQGYWACGFGFWGDREVEGEGEGKAGCSHRALRASSSQEAKQIQTLFVGLKFVAKRPLGLLVWGSCPQGVLEFCLDKLQNLGVCAIYRCVLVCRLARVGKRNGWVG
jgi:hypothetical protein